MESSSLERQRIRLPAILMCLYFIAVPFSIFTTVTGMSLLKIATIAVVIVALPLLFIGENEIKPNGMHLAWAAYLIYSFSTLFFLRDDISMETFRGLLQVSALAALLTLRVYNEREKKFILDTWVAIGIIMVGLMMFSSRVLEQTDSRETIYLFGQKADPNELCGYFILPLLVCMERTIKKGIKTVWRVFYIVMIVAMIFTVVRTGSRGGLLAVLVTALLFVLISVKGVRSKIIIAVVAAVVAVLVVHFLIPLLPEEVMERFNIDRIMSDRGSDRFDIWIALVSDLSQNISSFSFGKGFYATAETIQNAGYGNTVAHNHILQVFYDQGIVGCALFLWMLAAGFIRMFKNNRIIALSLLGMMALGMSLTMYPYYKPFWNILMMTALNFENKED